MNILIVDDHEEIRQMLREMLQENGYHVFVAENGKQAIDLLGVNKIDLIISDILMPEIEGVEFILRLRQSKIPVIAISGLRREDVVAQFFASIGVVGFLQKPFMVNDVAVLVNNARKTRKMKEYNKNS
ncbi:MAG: response regulator [Chitinivibrionales bacterium]|nr:response regulator [Chitinivibrionales bacterium]